MSPEPVEAMSPEPVEGRFSTQNDQSSIAGVLNLAVVAGVLETAFRQAQRSLIECCFDAIEVFGGSELGVEVAGDRVVMSGEVDILSAFC